MSSTELSLDSITGLIFDKQAAGPGSILKCVKLGMCSFRVCPAHEHPKCDLRETAAFASVDARSKDACTANAVPHRRAGGTGCHVFIVRDRHAMEVVLPPQCDAYMPTVQHDEPLPQNPTSIPITFTSRRFRDSCWIRMPGHWGHSLPRSALNCWHQVGLNIFVAALRRLALLHTGPLWRTGGSTLARWASLARRGRGSQTHEGLSLMMTAAN